MTDPAGLAGATRAMLECGIPDAGDLSGPRVDRSLAALSVLTTGEAAEAMEKNGLNACSALFRTANSLVTLSPKGHVAYDVNFEAEATKLKSIIESHTNGIEVTIAS